VREADHTRRVVITGLGILSPIGNDPASVWTSLTEMKSGLGRITHWDPTAYSPYVVAGEIRNFDPAAWLDPKSIRRTGPEIHWGVAAAKQALAHSGLAITDENREEIGVVFGSGAGGQGLFIENQMAWKEKGPRSVAPTFIAHGLVDSTSGMIAIETGALGHNMAVVSACATGTHALGEAAEAIKRGDVTAVISGSTENPLIEVAHIGFMNMRGLGAPRDGEGPASASRPFDADRAGFVLGEGAGAFIVEDLEHAKARGATIYAEVVGYGSSADAHDMIQPVEGGAGAARSIKWALQRGKIDPSEIDMINPHGTSTPVGDAREALAFHSALGARAAQIPISATKSLTGHLMGAAGAVEAIFTALSLHHQTIPGTLNTRNVDPECNLTVALETRQAPLRAAISNNIGLGGHNGAVVLRHWTGK